MLFLRKQIKAILYRLVGWRIQRYIDKSIEVKLQNSLDGHVKNYIDLSVERVIVRRSDNLNNHRLLGFKDKHKGQRAFVLGNGPSLLIGDLDRLNNEITFASNKIFLAFEETDWRPTYYSISDVLVAENNLVTIQHLQLNKIFASDVKRYLADANDIIWVRTLMNSMKDGEPEDILFSTDLVTGGYGGWTVIYTQLQIAFYMGIREIYLIGVDYSFSIPKPTERMSMHGQVLEHTDEVNHFHPKYRERDEKWTMPRLDIHHKAFSRAKQVFEENGGHIYNASRKTALDVFPLVDFDKILPPNQPTMTVKPLEPLVSVIIPVFNGEKYIKEAIESVLQQTYPNLEIIIIEDGSTDNTPDILNKYAAQEKITLLTHANRQNLGVSHSRKVGIEQAKGKYITFLDADDIFVPDKIAIQVKALAESPDAILCHTNIKLLSETEEYPPILESYFDRGPLVHKYMYSAEPYFLKANHICNSTTMVHTDILRGLPSSYIQLYQVEDWLMWTLLADYGYFLYLPQKLIHYRYHASSATAKTQASTLSRQYFKIELYLSLLSRLKDKQHRLTAIQQLQNTIIQLFNLYAVTDKQASISATEIIKQELFFNAEMSILDQQQTLVDNLTPEDIAKRIPFTKVIRALSLKVINKLDNSARTSEKTLPKSHHTFPKDV